MPYKLLSALLRYFTLHVRIEYQNRGGRAASGATSSGMSGSDINRSGGGTSSEDDEVWQADFRKRVVLGLNVLQRKLSTMYIPFRPSQQARVQCRDVAPAFHDVVANGVSFL